MGTQPCRVFEQRRRFWTLSALGINDTMWFTTVLGSMWKNEPYAGSFAWTWQKIPSVIFLQKRFRTHARHLILIPLRLFRTCNILLQMQRVQWRKEVQTLRNVLSSHEQMLNVALIIDLPYDVIMIIIDKLHGAVISDFLFAMRRFLDGLGFGIELSDKCAYARQNAIYEMVLTMYSHQKAAFWHFHRYPEFLSTITSKLNELITLNAIRQSSVRQRLRSKHLYSLRERWMLAFYSHD